MLEVGLKGKLETVVTQENTAVAMQSGTLEVFATPAMLSLAEETAWKSVAEELEEGCSTVGIRVAVNHLSATPVGMKVTCYTALTEIDGRRLVFDVRINDEAGVIGEGVHERFIIQTDKFLKRAESKLQKTTE